MPKERLCCLVKPEKKKKELRRVGRIDVACFVCRNKVFLYNVSHYMGYNDRVSLTLIFYYL